MHTHTQHTHTHTHTVAASWLYTAILITSSKSVSLSQLFAGPPRPPSRLGTQPPGQPPEIQCRGGAAATASSPPKIYSVSRLPDQRSVIQPSITTKSTHSSTAPPLPPHTHNSHTETRCRAWAHRLRGPTLRAYVLNRPATVALTNAGALHRALLTCSTSSGGSPRIQLPVTRRTKAGLARLPGSQTASLKAYFRVP